MNTATTSATLTTTIEELLTRLLRIPNPENCQPWSFVLDDQRVEVFHDSARMRFGDMPYDLSPVNLGMIAEGMEILASAVGLRPELTFLLDHQSDTRPWLVAEFHPAQTRPDPLAPAFASRHSDRRKYAGDADLRTAFQQLRGEAGELFTIQPDGQRTDRLHLAVELLVEPTVQDSWGAQATLKYTRLRYGIAIVRRTDEQGLDRLYVEHEALAPIPRSEDRWSKRYGLLGNEHWLPPLTGGRSAAFISTSNERDRATVYLHQDGRSGRKSSVAERMERTVLSGVLNTEFPHAFAAREAMRAWRFLQLNPEVLRQPSSMVGPQRMAADGRYLPGALARLQATDPLLLAKVRVV